MFLALLRRSWCYAFNMVLELLRRSCCYASSMFFLLMPRFSHVLGTSETLLMLRFWHGLATSGTLFACRFTHRDTLIKDLAKIALKKCYRRRAGQNFWMKTNSNPTILKRKRSKCNAPLPRKIGPHLLLLRLDINGYMRKKVQNAGFLWKMTQETMCKFHSVAIGAGS